VYRKPAGQARLPRQSARALALACLACLATLPPDAAAQAPDRVRLAGADPFAALDADALRDLLRGYYAYFGRYEVSAAGDSITHFVETSLRPGEVGVEYRREIRIEGDRLYISLNAEVDGVPRRRVLTWRRAAIEVGSAP